MIRIAVIGYGYWGPNLVRNFLQTDGVAVVAVCDRSDDRRAAVERVYPAVRTYADVDEVLAAGDVDAVAIATPVSTHFDLAMRALAAGKHVLVEKPMTSTVAEGETLVAEAAERGLTLMVDHTFVYTSAVRKIRELLAGGGLGELYYYDSVRVNLGLFQHDVSVLWDLAVHDLSIMDYVLRKQPVAVSATGLAHVPGRPENIAYMTMFFDGSLIAHVHVNWLSPVKVRRTLLGGSRRMVVFDDLEASEKIKVYDRGISMDASPESLYQMRVGYRTGDMWAPQLAVREALSAGAAHFIDCITRGLPPLTDGAAGLRVVRLLEAAGVSIANNGEPVALANGAVSR
jgi:predicted dehydrogenase